MKKTGALVAAALALGLAASIALEQPEPRIGAQEPTTVGIDAIPAGNTATSLGDVQECASVANGETFTVDIFVQRVINLLAWELHFQYDPAILEVVDRDTQLFQAANQGSSVIDISAGVPDRDGVYLLAAADIGDASATDSGSGVLARVTLRAVGSGVSPASLAAIDANEDGEPDVGPLLVDIEGEAIDDVDGDTFFDGPIFDAEIRVNSSCPAAPLPPSPAENTPPPADNTPSPPDGTPGPGPTSSTATPTLEPGNGTPATTPRPDDVTATARAGQAVAPRAGPPGEDGDDGPSWIIIGIATGGGIAALLAAGYLPLRAIRQRKETPKGDSSGGSA